MVVDVIDVDGVAPFESKSHPPIARNAHREVAPEPPFQRVQSESWKVHVRRTTATVEHGQNVAQPLEMIGRNATRAATRVQRPQTAMPKRQDHDGILDRCMSGVNLQATTPSAFPHLVDQPRSHQIQPRHSDDLATLELGEQAHGATSSHAKSFPPTARHCGGKPCARQ